jgi:5-methylcytosine-specific restriction endonuclease McrA
MYRRDEAIRLYQEGNSMAQVAKMVGTTAIDIYYLLKQNNIKTRTKKQALQKYVKYNVCVICGTSFRARAAWDAKTSLFRKTCSDNCEFELRSQKSKEMWTDERKKKMSEVLSGRDTSGWNIPKRAARPNWEGGRSSNTYRRIAFEDLKMDAVCEACGSTDEICVHHRDKNRQNNTRENLMIVCKSCHTGMHSLAGDCGWKLYNSKKDSNGVSV